MPVITSSVSSLPEVAGEAAYLIDPANPEELTSAMIRMVNEPDLRNELIKKGFERTAHFSWKSTASNVLEIYKEIGVPQNGLN